MVASDPTQIRAVDEKGKPLHRAVDGSCRDSTTVLAFVSATGDCLPPLIVFKGMAVQSRWTSVNEYPGTMYGANSNGWMEEETFYQWLERMFVRHVQEDRQKLNRPLQPHIFADCSVSCSKQNTAHQVSQPHDRQTAALRCLRFWSNEEGMAKKAGRIRSESDGPRYKSHIFLRSWDSYGGGLTRTI